MSGPGRLDGRVSLVTGGASGIGAASARALAAEGSAVVIADLDLEAAQSEAEALVAAGRRAAAIRADVAVEADAEAAVALAAERFGRLDILVNNAGFLQAKPFLELTADDFDRMYAVHVRGAFLFSRAAAPLMQRQRFGRIVNISSGGGVGLGSPHATHYHAAKAAQTVLGHGVGMALAHDGVTVNSVVPGFVRTPLWDKADSDWKAATGRSSADELAARVAGSRLGRPVEPEEVAHVVVFFALPESVAISGQIVAVTE